MYISGPSHIGQTLGLSPSVACGNQFRPSHDIRRLYFWLLGRGCRGCYQKTEVDLVMCTQKHAYHLFSLLFGATNMSASYMYVVL